MSMEELYEDMKTAHQRIKELEQERDNWIETAKQHCRNEDYYRGLVVSIGVLFGPVAYTSDDGSVQLDVLCAKVPELVEQALSCPEYWDIQSINNNITHENLSLKAQLGEYEKANSYLIEQLADIYDESEAASYCMVLKADNQKLREALQKIAEKPSSMNYLIAKQALKED